MRRDVAAGKLLKAVLCRTQSRWCSKRGWEGEEVEGRNSSVFKSNRKAVGEWKIRRGMQCRVNITTQRRQLITHINTIEMREGDHNHETAHQRLKVLCNHSRHIGTIQYARPAFLKLPQPYRFSNVSHSLTCTQPTTQHLQY